MMNETVKLILSLSLSGSILALLIFALKPFIKDKLSRSIQYYIWIIVLLRLVIPFSFENSIMNQVFYGNQTTIESGKQVVVGSRVQPKEGTKENIATSTIPNVQANIVNGVYADDVDHNRFFRDLFNQYVLYLWLVGVIIALTVNLVGYVRFLKYLKPGYRQATEEENRILSTLLNGKSVRLFRNRFVATPMLIGILRPCIIIPDVNFNEKQLKNILLHEISHLRRFDIMVKWLTMIASSIHWFNPLMYFLKKEISNACELACDEAVIKNLSPAEKQAYGDTLISVIAEHKYPVGALQATMCEEKRSLKERLISIMNHNKKSKPIMIFSGVLLGFIILGAFYLGAGVGSEQNTPPNLYISTEEVKSKVALRGSYSWENDGEYIHADSDHPVNFAYKSENTVSVAGKEQLIINTKKLESDKKYNFTIENVEIFKDGQLVELETKEPSMMNGNLYIQAPSDAGEYIYTLSLNFKDKGTVSYGFVVRVDMVTYDLAALSKYKTPYVGDNSKVSHIAGLLPVPDKYFSQRYISMKTDGKPYSLTIYYEPASDTENEGEWPINPQSSAIETNVRNNALVVFSMIDNLDEVTFAFRNSSSDGKLNEKQYVNPYTFKRADFKEEYGNYGNLSALGENLDALQEVLTKKTSESQSVLENNELEYVNESLGYAIKLPKSVKNRVTINKNKNTVYIVSKKVANSSEFPGIILFINPMSKSQYPSRQNLEDYIKDESPVPMVIIGETENDYICYSFATDVQYPTNNEALKDEYNDLVNEFNNNGFGFRALR